VRIMVDIRITAVAEAALNALGARQADAVSDAISSIPVTNGERIDLPGVQPPSPFLVTEPADRSAPVVLYRAAARGEEGDWIVVSLIKRDEYEAARKAERTLAGSPPAVRDLANAVAGTLAAFVSSAEETQTR
jgi:hypothetical protein